MQWLDIPALGRYWIEQVFAVGYAFNYDKSPAQLLGHTLMVVQTAGGPSEVYTDAVFGGSDKLGTSFKAISM